MIKGQYNEYNELIDPVETHRPVVQSHLDRTFGTWMERVSKFYTANRDGKGRFISIRVSALMRMSWDEKIRIYPCRRGMIGQLERKQPLAFKNTFLCTLRADKESGCPKPFCIRQKVSCVEWLKNEAGLPNVMNSILMALEEFIRNRNRRILT